MRILLIEDEPDIARLVGALIAREGFSVEQGCTLDDALEASRREAYDLMILDRRLPDGDSLSLLPTLRRNQPGVRIIMLTALDALNERVSGLDAGADDYLTKPFEEDELLARVRACLRRPGAKPLPPARIGALAFDFATHEVTVSGEPLALRRRECLLLGALMRRAGRVVNREVLLDDVYRDEAGVQPHALDTLIWRLRRRLADAASGVTIHLIKGIGFALIEIER